MTEASHDFLLMLKRKDALLPEELDLLERLFEDEWRNGFVEGKDKAPTDDDSLYKACDVCCDESWNEGYFAGYDEGYSIGFSLASSDRAPRRGIERYRRDIKR